MPGRRAARRTPLTAIATVKAAFARLRRGRKGPTARDAPDRSTSRLYGSCGLWSPGRGRQKTGAFLT
eukprot:3895486-Heterocapsa_arctica.AAC.1